MFLKNVLLEPLAQSTDGGGGGSRFRRMDELLAAELDAYEATLCAGGGNDRLSFSSVSITDGGREPASLLRTARPFVDVSSMRTSPSGGPSLLLLALALALALVPAALAAFPFALFSVSSTTSSTTTPSPGAIGSLYLHTQRCKLSWKKTSTCKTIRKKCSKS